MKTVIFDLDGTLADLTHRLHYVRNGNRQWDKFFKECLDDKPIDSVITLNNIIQAASMGVLYSDIKIIIVSGRSDEVRKETAQWLAIHHIYYSELIMRPAGDYTPDHILKEQILDRLIASGHNILFTVDDRQRVVDMWRKRGIVCLQAAAWDEGDTVKIPSDKKGLLTLMVGPCGSGKSTWLTNNYFPFEDIGVEAATHNSIHPNHIISSDQIRADLCGDFRDQTRNGEVFAALHAVAKVRIDNGLPTVIDATNIKAADRKAAVKLADGGKVRYIVLDRPMEEKRRDGGWRNEVGFDLLAKHQQTFDSNIKAILNGDGFPNVEVIDLRKI